MAALASDCVEYSINTYPYVHISIASPNSAAAALAHAYLDVSSPPIKVQMAVLDVPVLSE